jgi:hypothetical protein
MVAARASASTCALSWSPTLMLPLSRRPTCEHGLAALARVADDKAHADQPQLAAVAHLAAALGVEGRAVEHHHAGLAGGELLDGLARPSAGRRPRRCR